MTMTNNNIITPPWVYGFREVVKHLSFKQKLNLVPVLASEFKFAIAYIHYYDYIFSFGLPKITLRKALKPVRKSQLAYGKVAQFFYKKGLKGNAQFIFNNILHTCYQLHIERKRLTMAAFPFGRFVSFIFRELIKRSIPIKLVPRFIRRRVRRVPILAKPVFQQRYVWRELVALGRVAYGDAIKKMLGELDNLLNNTQSSTIFAKLLKLYQEIDKNKVYVRRPKVRRYDFNRMLKHLKNTIWASLPRKDRNNYFYRRMLVVRHLKAESKHLRALTARHLVFKKRLYRYPTFKHILMRYIDAFYSESYKLTKLVNA